MADFVKHIGRFPALVACLYVSFFAMPAGALGTYTTGQWQVNAWGAPAPIYVSREAADVVCSRSGERARYFELKQRRGGAAELTLPGVLSPGQGYAFRVMLRTAKGTGSVDLFFRRDGFPYESIAIHTVTVGPEWTEVQLKGIYVSSGSGSVRLAVREEQVGLCVKSARLDSIPASDVGMPTPIVRVGQDFFGIHLNKLGTHNGWPNFNPGVVRLWDTGTTWSLLQPVPGPIDWAGNVYAQRLDYYIRHGRKYNPNVDFILTLGMTPIWAGRLHAKRCNQSSYGERSCTMPLNINDWRHYVRELALRYRGRVKIWEVWNEADVWVQWDESPQSMVELVRAAYEELKAVDPANIVIGPNVTSAGLHFLNDFIVAGGAKYIDGISVHAYVGRSPESSLNSLRNFREFLKSYNLNLPIWNTETGVSCILDEDCRGITGAAYKGMSGDIALAQGLLGNAALGIANFTYYTWEGASRESGGLPLVQPDYVTSTSTGRVVERIRLWIDGAVVKFEPSSVRNLNLISITHDGAKAFVLWSRGGQVSIQPSALAGVDRSQSLTDHVGRKLSAIPMVVGREPVLLYGPDFRF